MKKGIITALIATIIIGGAWYMLSNAGNFIKQQIEQQGSKYIGTRVSLFSVDLALTEGRLSINDLDVENPVGFSKGDAFSLESIVLDLGDITSEPYSVQNISVNAPEILYELDAAGQGNLLTLKNNILQNLPKNAPAEAEPKQGENPLVIVENLTISKVRLKLDFEKLDTGDLKIDQRVYEIELPTFSAGAIGKPNGMPADQVGAAIVTVMLDKVIAQAKAAVKQRIAEETKNKAMEKVDQEKDKLKEKATDKLKNLLNNS